MHHSDPAARPQPVALLSVVMAVYNEAATVAEVIEDVLTLDLNDRRLELIIVESNSTDGSREIAKNYEQYPEVKLVLQPAPRGKGNAV
ncbi:MAG: glycosyltransferase, partial [Ilumatobacteraceae bacterium]